MTIHTTHPFPSDDDPARRLRGRLGGAVSLWTAGGGPGRADGAGGAGRAGGGGGAGGAGGGGGGGGAGRAGLTVSSLLLAGGEPPRLLALVDPDSDLVDALAGSGRAVVHLLSWSHRDLADAFAGVAPAPGGPFRTGTFEDGDWGPRLVDASTWAGVRLESSVEVGWSLLLTAAVEHLEVGEDTKPLLHRRGRYATLDS